MSEAVENSASLAWRVLATLEVGSFAVIGTAALLAHTVRAKWRRNCDPNDTVKSVLISSDSKIGLQIKKILQSNGCTAHILTSDEASAAISDNFRKSRKPTFDETKFVDALVVIGAENKPCDLDRLSEIVSEDISCNIKKLNSLSVYVRRGGHLVWVSMSDATSGAFSGASRAFNDVLRANVELVAKSSQQKAVWVCRRRSESSHKVAERVVAALLPTVGAPLGQRFSIRNATTRIVEYVWRWFKVI